MDKQAISLLYIQASTFTEKGGIWTTPVIDTSLVTALVNVIKELMSIFTVYPLNIIVIGMIGGIGFKWLRSAKKAAK